MSPNFRPRRPALALLVLATALPAVARAQLPTPAPPTERERVAQAERILLDPMVDNKVVLRTVQYLATVKGGHKALIRAADRFARDRNDDNLATTLRFLAESVRDRPDLIPDRLIPLYVRLLETRKDPDPAVIALMGSLGPRARAALPSLRSLRDGQDPARSLEATRAIARIERNKE